MDYLQLIEPMVDTGSKYWSWYKALMAKASARELTGYCEKHHVAPKSILGENKGLLS